MNSLILLTICLCVDQMQAVQPLLRSLDVDLTPENCTECSVFTVAALAKCGDHIAVRAVSNSKPDVIWHHGIFIDANTIVHMHPNNNISSITIDKFMAHTIQEPGSFTDRAAIINYARDSDQSRALTSKRALMSIDDSFMQSIVYDGLKDNCECFAVWCRTDRYDSCSRIICILSLVPITHAINCAHKLRAGGNLSK